MSDFIPYGRQEITETDIRAVIDVLRSDFLTQGPTVAAFELDVAQYCGTKHAVAVNSATSALHLACLVLDVGKGDIVWTSPISFVASANCALYCGAEVDFVDIDPQTYNMSVSNLAEKLARAEKLNRLPKVVIPVHLCGQACEMADIQALAQHYGFKIIEDASHAIGGKYRGQPIGNSLYSDITVFSFHPVKIITTGEGGMALTNSEVLAQRMAQLRSHGITRDPKQMTSEPDGPWYYQQIDLGFNYRMTDIQAALGLAQMKRLDTYVSQRNQLTKRYNEMLEILPLILPWQHPDCYSASHLYIIRLKLADIGKSHRKFFENLRAKGIGVNLHYIPIYLQPYYKKIGFNTGHCPEAERYYEEAISLPIFPGLSQNAQDSVIEALHVLSLPC